MINYLPSSHKMKKTNLSHDYSAMITNVPTGTKTGHISKTLHFQFAHQPSVIFTYNVVTHDAVILRKTSQRWHYRVIENECCCFQIYSDVCKIPEHVCKSYIFWKLMLRHLWKCHVCLPFLYSVIRTHVQTFDTSWPLPPFYCFHSIWRQNQVTQIRQWSKLIALFWTGEAGIFVKIPYVYQSC